MKKNSQNKNVRSYFKLSILSTRKNKYNIKWNDGLRSREEEKKENDLMFVESCVSLLFLSYLLY